MKKHIGTLLIIVGLAIVAFPFIGRYIADQRQQAMLDAFYLEQESNQEADDTLSELDAIFTEAGTEAGQEELDAAAENGGISLDGSGIEEGSTSSSGNSMTLGEQPDVVGIINIPTIDLKAPIAEGADLDTLRFAVGHMEDTAALGTIGNAVVAGHRSHSFGVYFNRLDEVAIGDEITVEAGGKVTTYVVYETKLVEPDDTSVLKNSSKYKVLTLITCDPVYNPTHRLIVHAIDKEQQDAALN